MTVPRVFEQSSIVGVLTRIFIRRRQTQWQLIIHYYYFFFLFTITRSADGIALKRRAANVFGIVRANRQKNGKRSAP